MLIVFALAIALSGTPTMIHDGDTFHVQGQRVRLAGIDAPEAGQICFDQAGAAYECGGAARAAMARLIGGRQVSCAGAEIDRYGRPVVICTAAGDTLSLNEQMVREGEAVAYDYGRQISPYHADEAAARRAGIGVWAGRFELPGNWRREHRR